jgi:hypothetical protein
MHSKKMLLNSLSDITLTQVIVDITSMLPQLDNFITQFNTVITNNNINVITDSFGNMDIEVPTTISEQDGQNIAKRVSVLDRLIHTHDKNIQDLFKKGYEMNKALDSNLDQKAQLDEKMQIYKSLMSKYKH